MTMMTNEEEQVAHIRTPEGFEPVLGPVASVPTLTSEGRREGCVTVGNRVMAWWERFGYLLGNGTVVGFERHIETGWIKVVIDYDYTNAYDVKRSHDGFLRWDYDRTILCHPAHWEGETQEVSVARQREHLRKQALGA